MECEARCWDADEGSAAAPSSRWWVVSSDAMVLTCRKTARLTRESRGAGTARTRRGGDVDLYVGWLVAREG